MGKVFSEYELLEIGIKFVEDEAFTSIQCIGSGEDTADVKVIKKMCRGVVKKKRVKATGTGVVKMSMHCPWDVFTKMFGMKDEKLIDGVYAYGENSRHEVFCMVQKVEDEDGNIKFKAYPNCIIETGKATKVENGAEEVAEIEIEVAYSPDDYGNGSYEALVDEMTEDALKTTWMTAFKPELVRVTNA